MRSNILKNISGDKKLNFFEHLYWLLIAYVNVKIDRFKVNKEIKVLNYKPKRTYNFLKKNKPSPSRYWCDLFWQELPYKLIFNRGFRALEVGCGSGIYGNFLQKKAGFKNYTGIDIDNKWKAQSKKIKFFKDSFQNVDKYLNKINFLFTQSALEHFDEDIDFHIKVSKHIQNRKKEKKFFQLHLVPSEQCLFTYLAHGYRHFSINNISKICSFYSKKENNFFIFKLGSINSFKLHLRYITLPRFISKITSRYNETNYEQKLDRAILKDKKYPNNKNCSFYAIMILSNYKNSELKKILNHYK